ncbi:MAG: STT3 domain-containing protein [archaeon]
MSKKTDKQDFELDMSMLKNSFKKVNSFIDNHFSKQILFGIILISIAFFFSLNVRLESIRLGAADDWARDSVYNQFKQQIEMQLSQDPEFQSLPSEMQNQRIEAEFKRSLDEMGNQLQQQVDSQSDMIRKHFQNENNTTYLLGIDPYHYLRRTENILEYGHIGDFGIKENGTPQDMLMHSGVGSDAKINLLEYTGVLFHKINQFFNSGADLMYSISLVPAVMFSFVVIFTYIIIFLFTKSYLASFFASLFMGLTPGMVHATSAGFFDTGVFEIFFPVLSLMLVLLLFREKNTYKKIGLALLNGVIFGLFYLGWSAWWYAFTIFLGSLFIYVLYLIIEYFLVTKKDIKLINDKKVIKKNFKNTLFTILLFLVSSYLAIGFVSGNFSPSVLFNLNRLTGRLEISSPTRGLNIWPNVFTTVAELNRGSIGQAVSSLGGEIFFYLSFFGIIALFYDAFKNKDSSKLAGGIFLASLIAGGIYTTLEGVRFIRLLLPFLIISLGFAFYYIKQLLSYFIDKNKPDWFKRKHKLIALYIPLIVIFLLAIFPMYSQAYSQAKGNVPQMTDGWYTSLEHIEENTDDGALMFSWWDFGHWFKGVAKRPVLFDGASQNSPVAHWAGRALLSGHDESYGINRMLACGSRNSAYDTLYEETNDSFEALKLLENLIMMNESEARGYLNSMFNSEFSETMLNETHCKDREIYIVASEDMVGKSGVWGHFGSWNFTRSHLWNTYRSNRRDIQSYLDNLSDKINISDDEAVDIYYELSGMTQDQAQEWISPWPSFMGSEKSCSKNKNLLSCQEGLEINLNNLSDSKIRAQGREMQPYSIFYYDYEDEEFKEEILNKDAPFSVSLINESNSYSTAIGDNEVIGGLFDKLFFHSHIEEIGNYELFHEDRSIIGGRIYYWKVNWD